MIRTPTLCATLILGLALAGCAAPMADKPAVDTAAVETEITEVLRRYSESINAGNWSAAIELYSDDDRFHWAEDGRIAYPTKAAAEEAIGGLGASVESTRMSADEVRITVLSATLAQATFTYTQSLQLRSGPELEFSGVITMTLRKEPEGWKVLSGHSSSPRQREQSG